MFVQIIDMHTSHYDEIEALDAEWRAATEGQRSLRREVVARDRNDPNRYLIFAFFDSHGDAMKNSELPATGEFAGRMAALCDQPPAFIDLDVLEDR